MHRSLNVYLAHEVDMKQGKVTVTSKYITCKKKLFLTVPYMYSIFEIWFFIRICVLHHLGAVYTNGP